MILELTLVRLTENKEPVLAVEKCDNLANLGQLTDESTCPNSCEYKDVSVEFQFALLWCGKREKDSKDDEQNFDLRTEFLECGSLPYELFLQLNDEFEADKGWTEFPENFDYMSLDIDDEDRVLNNPEKSIF